ncbi:peptidoglycan-binding domain-containing protein [Halalkalibacter alkalisediminis]|uniref:Peptidoglycan-binding protein n=1 Tax=Halalkalibacter alkalisediminis TaxID=935616 RepID=A0ABV6NHL8_9BACI|nr:peptidoglycan-binding domain-containing protein [Halalkalibacter alkalisediminis]
MTEFQQQLHEHGYYSGVDGIFGPKTAAAVR